jgi:hypothetical protein
MAYCDLVLTIMAKSCLVHAADEKNVTTANLMTVLKE